MNTNTIMIYEGVLLLQFHNFFFENIFSQNFFVLAILISLGVPLENARSTMSSNSKSSKVLSIMGTFFWCAFGIILSLKLSPEFSGMFQSFKASWGGSSDSPGACAQKCVKADGNGKWGVLTDEAGDVQIGIRGEHS